MVWGWVRLDYFRVMFSSKVSDPIIYLLMSNYFLLWTKFYKKYIIEEILIFLNRFISPFTVLSFPMFQIEEKLDLAKEVGELDERERGREREREREREI